MPCFDKVINICKPYITESNGDGVSGSTKGKEAFNGGRETGFLRRHLEGVDKGHLGIEYHRRVSNTPCGDSHPTSNTPRRGVLPRTQSSIIRGDTGTPPKRSNYPTIRKCNRFCLHPLPSTEEERSDEASDQPETVESLGGDPPLQDGGNSYPSGSPPPRRLDGESGFEGCLFHHPHPPGSSEISEVHGGRELLPVHLPAIRPVLRPMDFHQGNETINDSAEVMGYQDNYLYRRHVDTGQLQGGGHTTPGSTCTPPGIPGLHHQSGEITPIPSPGNRISGTDCGLAGHPAQASWREAAANSQGSNPPADLPSCICSSTLPVHREVECNRTSHSSGTFVLPCSTGQLTRSPGSGEPELQSDAASWDRSPRGIEVVAASPDPMEWENYHSEISADSDPVRCFPLRMGSSVQRGEHGRLMDPTRTTTPHQLPRIVGSRLGLEIISKGSAASGSSATVGQLHSCGIHQQPGGNHFPSTHSSGENTVVVGPGEGHHTHSPTHPRCVQHCSRLRVQDGEGQVRLDVGSSSVPQDQRSPGTSRDRLIRFTADLPAATVFQLEARPPSSSSGCLSTGLESVERVCQPPMVLGGTSTEQGGIPTGSGNSGSPSVESPDMVSCPTQDVERLPSPSLSSGGSNAEGGTTEAVGGHPTTSRLACLRAKFRDSCLSSEASNLMLASWRSKSSQTYDSLFNKWIRWCGERHRDPVSGPIADVANFLAHLFEEGYQSRSLNSFRSAISSVHDPVDGVEVGKHPTISRLLKGAFHSRPPLPRYTSTWNVQVVLQYLEGLGPSNTLPLKQLTFKLTMLMCLTRPSRSADLASLQLDRRQYKPEGVVFLPSALAKQSSQGRELREFFFPSFPHNNTLCPVETLRCYERATASLRPEDTSKLFVAIVKPHKPVASCTIARWLRETLKLAGVDVSIFAGHSTRGASTSAAAGAGVTTADIMKAADWSTESVFRRHYYRSSHDASFGRAVLSTSSPGET